MPKKNRKAVYLVQQTKMRDLDCKSEIRDIKLQVELEEYQGIFSTYEKAVKACINEDYFLVKFYLDEPSPHETTSHNDLSYWEYPCSKKGGKEKEINQKGRKGKR